VAQPIEGTAVLQKGFTIPAYARSRLPIGFIMAMLTFFLVNVTWVFFRAQDFTTAWRLLTSMFTNVKGGALVLPTLNIIKVIVIIVSMIFFQWKLRNTKLLVAAEKMRWWVLGLIWAALLIALILSQESSSSFIYFQF
jgi:hypothetical protein